MRQATTRAQRDAVRELVRDLDRVPEVDPQGGAVPGWLAARVAELLRTPLAVGYRPASDAESGRQLGATVAAPGSEAFFERYRILGRESPGALVHYDPLRPEPDQRNVVRTRHEVCSCRPGEVRCVLHTVWRPLGIGAYDQLRILSCDGDRLLAWVGALREEPFNDVERRLMQRLARPLGRHLAVRRTLCEHDLERHGLAAALEALGRPAVIAMAAGRVVHANRAARDAMDAGTLTREAVQQRLARGDGRALGNGAAWLLIADDDPTRMERAAQRIGATAREREVLTWLLAGESNKEIAARLAVGESTVERHVTSLLAKARCDTRARLIATIWQRG